nr:hypothetical protein [Tanacetum cinerariifolium]
MGDANPIRTLGDYSKPSREGYRNTIELPEGKNVVPLHLKPFVVPTTLSIAWKILSKPLLIMHPRVPTEREDFEEETEEEIEEEEEDSLKHFDTFSTQRIKCKHSKGDMNVEAKSSSSGSCGKFIEAVIMLILIGSYYCFIHD